MSLSSLFAVDPRFNQAGLDWSNIGRFFIAQVVAGVIANIPAFAPAYMYSLLHNYQNLLYAAFLSISLATILYIAAGLWFGTRPNAKQYGLWTTLNLRSSDPYWYLTATLGAAILIAILVLIFYGITGSVGRTFPSPITKPLCQDIGNFTTGQVLAKVVEIVSVGICAILAFGFVLAALIGKTPKWAAIALTVTFLIVQTPLFTNVTCAALSPALILLLAIFVNFFFCVITLRTGSALPAVLASIVLQIAVLLGARLA